MNVIKTELFDMHGKKLTKLPDEGEYYAKQYGFRWMRTVVGYKTSEVAQHPTIKETSQ